MRGKKNSAALIDTASNTQIALSGQSLCGALSGDSITTVFPGRNDFNEDVVRRADYLLAGAADSSGKQADLPRTR
jgi:hypothetical protein